MRSRGFPARLVLALSVAAVLAVFLLYTSFAGQARPALTPSQLAGHSGKIELEGVVVGPVRGDAHAARGLRFRLRDMKGPTTAAVVYRGTVPPEFKPGRSIFMNGTARNGVFVADPGTMVTKCPSKYTPKQG